jgi:hypothetical protein
MIALASGPRHYHAPLERQSADLETTLANPFNHVAGVLAANKTAPGA